MDKSRRLDQVISTLRALKPELESRYQVEQVALFGSYVHQAEHSDSDLDVLVQFREAPSLLQFIELENALSESLGLKVDLVMREALKPRIGRRILEEMVPV